MIKSAQILNILMAWMLLEAIQMLNVSARTGKPNTNWQREEIRFFITTRADTEDPQPVHQQGSERAELVNEIINFLKLV